MRPTDRRSVPSALTDCLNAAKAHPNYKRPLGEDEGRGVAVGFWFNGGNQSSAEVHIADTGMVKIVEGSPDIGGSRASMALMAAETLGRAVRTHPHPRRDTDSTGYCATTGGSRTTFATGMAVIQACEDVIGPAQGPRRAHLGIDEEQVEWADGEARPAPGLNVEVEPNALSLADLARNGARTGGPTLRSRRLERARSWSRVLREHGGRPCGSGHGPRRR